MSHFVVYALVDGDADVEHTVEQLLAPYWEEKEVDPYDEPCYCVGLKKSKAWHDNPELNGDAIKKIRDVNEALPEVKEFRELRWKELRTKEDRAREKYLGNLVDALWREASADLFAARKALEDTVSGPEEDCDECKGSGVVYSTYNQKSKWDWYQIGGRFLSHWGDYLHVKDVLEPSPNRTVEEKIPFAIVTPDGEWHEKGSMGWWACVSDEKEEWPEIATKILEAHKDLEAVVLDVHI